MAKMTKWCKLNTKELLEETIIVGGCVRRRESADRKNFLHECTETDGGLSVCKLREVSPFSWRRASTNKKKQQKKLIWQRFWSETLVRIYYYYSLSLHFETMALEEMKRLEIKESSGQ